MIDILVSKGVSLLAASAAGKTALHLAVSKAHEELAVFLLEDGVPINIHDHERCAPLHDAVMDDSIEMIRFLLDKGATIGVTDTQGRTPLHFVVSSDVLSLLLEHGVMPDLEDKSKHNPLATALMRGNDEIACLLMERTEELSAVDLKGKTFLHHASEFHCLRALKRMLDKGLDTDSKDVFGRNPCILRVLLAILNARTCY